MPCIYLWVNITNDKIYVGQTKNRADKRRNQHLRDMKRVSQGVLRTNSLYSAMLSDGIDNFVFIEYFYVFDKKDLNYYEKLIISEMNSYSIGYNRTTGGGSGSECSELTKQLKSSAAKKLWQSEKFITTMSSARMTEQFHSIRSEASKKIWEDPEFRAKRKSSHNIATQKSSYKKAQSEAKKKFWANPETRALQIIKQNIGKNTEEYRIKRSEISKRLVLEGRIGKGMQVNAFGIIYKSKTSAWKALGLKSGKILERWIKEGKVTVILP